MTATLTLACASNIANAWIIAKTVQKILIMKSDYIWATFPAADRGELRMASAIALLSGYKRISILLNSDCWQGWG